MSIQSNIALSSITKIPVLHIVQQTASFTTYSSFGLSLSFSQKLLLCHVNRNWTCASFKRQFLEKRKKVCSFMHSINLGQTQKIASFLRSLRTVKTESQMLITSRSGQTWEISNHLGICHISD